METIVYEILRNSLYSIAREMKVAMMRTAASPIMHLGADASAAVFDAQMQLVAQGNDIPTMLGSAVISTRRSVETIGRDRLRPGDVIISNDVYLGGGNHQPDVQLTRPVFFGDEIVAFVMTRGHWSDIGGQTPGSYMLDTWDIFGEGVRIPPVRLFRNDEIVDDVKTLIVQNTRDPEGRLLDIQAQYAGTFVGDQRIRALCQKYGAQALADAMKRSLDHSEALMRAAIRDIPDGVYEAEDWVEGVYAKNWPADPVRIKVRVTVAGDEMHFDYAGSGAQSPGGINCPFAVTCNSTWFTVKAITDASIPINQGCYRPIHITAPEGSIVNCRFPAPVVSGNTETSPRVIDLLLKALSAAVPDRVIGQSNCAACSGVFGGPDPDTERVRRTGKPIVSIVEPHGGGMGARATQDGVNGIRVYVGNAGSLPVEYIEQTMPLVVEAWALVTDSGGAGRYRGGLTARRSYRVEFDTASFTVAGERGEFAPEGYFGGRAGAPFVCTVTDTEGQVRSVPPKGATEVLRRGDRVSLNPSGSGGYGRPIERDRQAVIDDVLDGYVSRESAERDYGLKAFPES
ncbi:MAG: hydantoinase B/oxoprolinase family protein [Betaproteobacteria bacterium]|nr:hydantoinase B/oxoprolinase family protein [Betaproteobacteria bacterium]